MPVPRHSLFDPATIDGLRAAADEAARAPGDGDAGAAARVCERIGAAVAASDAGRIDEARDVLAAALPGTTDLRLLFLGYQFHFRLGEYDEAERLVRRRLDLAPPDSPDASRAWTNLGLIHHFRADYESAEAAMRRALEIDTRIGNEEGVARDLGNLALIPEARGDLDAAERLFHQALDIAERIGADRIVASMLANLGEAAIARARPDEARTRLTRAAALFRAIGIEKHREHCARLLADLDNPRSPG